MTVRELIFELKKLPKDLQIVTAAHDNSDYEFQDFVNRVKVVDFSEAPDKTKKEFCYRERKMVVLTS